MINTITNIFGNKSMNSVFHFNYSASKHRIIIVGLILYPNIFYTYIDK